MWTSPLKLSALNSIAILLLFTGCAYTAYRHDGAQDTGTALYGDSPDWFGGEDQSLFTASAGIFGRSFSGLLVIKPDISGSHRVILITEFGLKIFDMEFLPDGGFELHYCVDAINKKYIINMLRKDFELIFRKKPLLGSSGVMTERVSRLPVIKEKEHGKKYFYYVNEGGSIKSIVRSSVTGKKVRADFYGRQGVMPDSLSILHYNVKMNLKLERIDENIPSSDEQPLRAD
jgi:hypothetical protein